MSASHLFNKSSALQSHVTPVPLQMYDHSIANQQSDDQINQRMGSTNPHSSMSISSNSTNMSPMLVRPRPIAFHSNNQSINQSNDHSIAYFSANQPQRSMFMQTLPLQSPRSINHSLVQSSLINQHHSAGSLPMRVTPSPYFKSIENQRTPRAQHDHNVVYSQLLASNPQFADISLAQRHDEIWRDFNTRSGTTPLPRPLSQLPTMSSSHHNSMEQSQLQAERDAALQQANLERMRRELREAEHQQQLRSLLHGPLAGQNIQYQISDRLVLEMGDSQMVHNNHVAHEPMPYTFSAHHPHQSAQSQHQHNAQSIRPSIPNSAPKPPQRAIGMRKLISTRTSITPVSARLALTKPVAQSSTLNSTLLNQSNKSSLPDDSFLTPAPLSRVRPVRPPSTTSGKSRIAPLTFDTPHSRLLTQSIEPSVSYHTNQPLSVRHSFPLNMTSDLFDRGSQLHFGARHILPDNVLDDDDNTSNASLGSCDSEMTSHPAGEGTNITSGGRTSDQRVPYQADDDVADDPAQFIDDHDSAPNETDHLDLVAAFSLVNADPLVVEGDDGLFESDEDVLESAASESDDEEELEPGQSDQHVLPVDMHDTYNVDFTRMQQEINLKDWWFEIHERYRKPQLEDALKASPSLSIDDIYAAGRVVIVCKGKADDEAWGSGVVLGRKVTNNQSVPSHLVTSSRLYRLIGCCDVDRMHARGWSEKSIRRLTNGLCPGWKSVIVDEIRRREGWLVDKSSDESDDGLSEIEDESTVNPADEVHDAGAHDQHQHPASHELSSDDEVNTPKTTVRPCKHIEHGLIDDQAHQSNQTVVSDISAVLKSESSEDVFVTPAVNRRLSRVEPHPVSKGSEEPSDDARVDLNDASSESSGERPIMRTKRWTKVEQTLLINAASSLGLLAEHALAQMSNPAIAKKWAEVAKTVGDNRNVDECKKQFDKFCKEQSRIEQSAILKAASRTSSPTDNLKLSPSPSAVADESNKQSHNDQTKTLTVSKSASTPARLDNTSNVPLSAAKSIIVKTKPKSSSSSSHVSVDDADVKRGRGRPRKDGTPAQPRSAEITNKPPSKPADSSSVARRAPHLVDDSRPHQITKSTVSAAILIEDSSSSSDEDDSSRSKPVKQLAKPNQPRPKSVAKQSRSDSDDESIDHVSATSSDDEMASKQAPHKVVQLPVQPVIKPAVVKRTVKVRAPSSTTLSKPRPSPDTPPSAVDRSAVAVAVSRHSGRTVIKPLDFWTNERELNGMVFKGADTTAVTSQRSAPLRAPVVQSSVEWSPSEKRALQNAFMNVWPVTKSTFWFDVAALLGTGRSAAECQRQHELQWKTPNRAKRKADTESEHVVKVDHDVIPAKKPRTMVTKKRAVRQALQERDTQYAGGDIFDATPFKQYKEKEKQIEKAAGRTSQSQRARHTKVLLSEDTDDDMMDGVFSVDRSHADAVIQRMKKDRRPTRERQRDTVVPVHAKPVASIRRVLDAEMRAMNAAADAKEARAANGEYESEDEIEEESE